MVGYTHGKQTTHSSQVVPTIQYSTDFFVEGETFTGMWAGERKVTQVARGFNINRSMKELYYLYFEILFCHSRAP